MQLCYAIGAAQVAVADPQRKVNRGNINATRANYGVLARRNAPLIVRRLILNEARLIYRTPDIRATKIHE